MVDRLSNLNNQFKAGGGGGSRKKGTPTSQVWESMGLDQHLSGKAIEMRKHTQRVMEACEHDLDKHTLDTSFPHWMIDKLRPIGMNGLQIKGYGSPGLSTAEAGAICYEMAKVDGSLATFVLVHNAIGMAVIDGLGDEEQKQRMLVPGVKFDDIYCFGLTEPDNGSDATGLKTTAKKVEGGYVLNGRKRWIGNATFGNVVVWARNQDDGNRIQAFVVMKGQPGFHPKKIENKMALRITQNADIDLVDCFVPDKNKLTFAKDFATGTNKILEASRIMVAWMAAGVAAGAYEAALKYALKRNQFGRPIAKFQLNQERLSRMLANCEFMNAHLCHVSNEFDKGKVTIGQVARAKANCTRLGREVCALARETCGGNGILLENRVIKCMNDMEVMYTYEGTYDINMLVSGRELTGGLAAFK